MFNNEKSIYVKRMLLERIMPSCQEFVSLFDASQQQIAQNFIVSNYPNEIPKKNEVVEQKELPAPSDPQQ